MAITKITITGSDDRTFIEDLIKLSDRYPLVEWGILFSTNRAGSTRYPSAEWLTQFLIVAKTYNINISAHLCGEWTRNFFVGNFSFLNKKTLAGERIIDYFQRIQLNFNATRNDYDVSKFISFIEAFEDKQFIFQCNNSNVKLCEDVLQNKQNNIAFLYDSSGGIGKLPTYWPSPFPNYYTGYAGGLNPENLKSNIIEIVKMADGKNIWIDVETGVRDGEDDKLNLSKIESFLEIATPFC